ncbi:MAG: DUF11 domain-containing protein [Thermoflexales bacterium]|nr:DUF11 domain-containing protein [Thermoflexales bacterium]
MRIKLAGSFIVCVGMAAAMLFLFNGTLLAGQLTAANAAPADELHVCSSDCPYSSVQAAVDAANEGDVIKVAAGAYTSVSARDGLTQVVYLDKAVTIQGGYTTTNWTTPDPETNITTLDAQGQGRVLYISVDGIPTIAGLHITGGNASNQGRGEVGGGIYAEIEMQIAPETIIANNTIYSNTAYDGGGVYLDQGAGFALRGNTIVSNTAERAGGGMAARNIVITLIDNVFAANRASLGGGLDVEYGADAVLQGNTFRANSAGSAGGGVYVFDSTAKFDTNAVVSNTAQRGGGLAIFGRGNWRDSAWVNTLVADNQASIEGTGIYISGAPLHLWHTTLASNSGGDGSGVTIGNWNPWSTSGSSTVDMRNTIVASQGTGLRITDGSAVAIDSILWHSTPITVSGTLVSVQNQITGDPDFLDAGGGDYHLGAASAARDAGIVTGTPKDMDGQVRPMGFGYDLGADEYSEAALSLVKGPSLVGANVEELVTYTIVVTSSGSRDTSGIVLTDTLDALQRATLVDSPLGNCAIEDVGWGGAVVCTPGALNSGESLTISLTAQVSATAPLGQAMTNTLTARANEAANSTQATVFAQDCHVHIGDNATEYTSVQAAVDAADPGALVKVAGTCMGVHGREGARQQVHLEWKSISIQGGYTTTGWTTPDPEAHPTTLDARGLGRVFYIYQPPVADTTLIDGLRITGGNAYGQMGGHDPFAREESSGGGVYIFGGGENFTLSHNRILNNTAAKGGGGMYTSFTEGHTFIGNTFAGNRTLEGGGGLLVHAGWAILADNVFDSNSAEVGGGFAAGGAAGANFTRDTFVGNSARSFGGGLALETGSVLSATSILSNTAQYGGGIAFYERSNPWDTSVTLINTVIAGNQASLEGAGMFITPDKTVYMLQTTLARNGGGDGSGVTLGWYDWQGPGTSTVVMTNTIVASQTVGVRVTGSSTATVNGVLWHATPVTVSQSPSATVSVQNQITGDPAFLAGGDYHIGAASAARDAGVDSGVMVDRDGQLRPMGLGWDLGTDEYPAPALSVSKQPSAAFVNRGQVMSYTLGVTNIGLGSADATGVVLTDTLDNWQRIAGAPAGNCAITNPGWGGAVVCAVGTLSSGASATITLTVEVSGTVPLGQAMVNTAVARANEARSSTAQATIYAQNCHVRIGDAATEYASVQTAVDAASEGDVVKVAGTCLGVGERAGLRQQVYLDKSLTVRGGYTTINWVTPDPEANPTTLDAMGEGRVFYVTGPSVSPTIEGLRLTGGDAAGLGGVEWGWDAGGGLYVVSATATISNTWIYFNIAGEEFTLGGGVFLQNSDSTLSGNTIFSNTARYGGGILTLSSPAALSNNSIMSNTAIKGGGGAALWGGAIVVSGNTIRGNTAHEIGGGLSVGAPGSRLINNIVADNFAEALGSGLYIDGSAQFWHTTVARNTTGGDGDGSGIYVTTGAEPISVAFTNTILAQQGVGISVTAGNTVTVNGILWYATPITVSQSPSAMVEVQNQYMGDPAFLDNADYHINATSAAIDRGVNAGVLTDIDGDARPQGSGFDLGADEYVIPTKPVTGLGPITFEPLPITITVEHRGPGDCLSEIGVQQFDENHPQAATDNFKTGRYWYITQSACQPGEVFTVTLTVSLGSVPADDLDKLCWWTDEGWDCGEQADHTVTAATITRANVHKFSTWTVAYRTGPTAVRLRSLANVAGFNLVSLGVALVVGVLGAGWIRAGASSKRKK